MKYDTQMPFIASYVIVKNERGQIAFVLRSNTSWMNGYYGLPSGKTEKNESFEQGAIREAKEEIGIDVERKDIEHAITVHRYSDEDNNKALEWVDVYFLVKKWQGNIHNAEPHMHSELAWFDIDKLPENTIDSVAESLKAWSEGKKYFEHGWRD